MAQIRATAELLSARAKRARAAREQRRHEVRAIVDRVLGGMLPAGAEAWLIGSVAWGGFGEHSDIDVVVRGVPPDLAVEIERGLSRATGVVVDWLDLDSLPASFRRRVLDEGIAFRGA